MSPAPVTRLIGRPGHVERLTALVKEANSGHGRTAVIVGEPGTGKTALLDATCGHAIEAGFRVARATAEQLDQRHPFAAVGACLDLWTGAPDPTQAAIERLLSGVDAPVSTGQAGAADTEFAVTEAVLALLDEWCTRGPVLLVLDDLHWADPASVALVHRLGRASRQLPLLVAVACRPVRAGHPIEVLLHSLQRRGALWLELPPLAPAAVDELAETMLGLPPDGALRDLLGTAGGNPLHVTEMLRALHREGRIRPVGQHAELAPGSDLPGTLPEVIWRELRSLTRDTTLVLQAAALLGAGFSAAELGAVLDRPVPDLLAPLREASLLGVVTAAGDRLAFRHELVRQALADGLPDDARAALHQQAGRALIACGGPVERAATHLLAGQRLDRHTVSWVMRVASGLTVRSPLVALDLLGLAIDAVGPDDPCRGALVDSRIRALLWSGQAAAAEQEARAALAAQPGRTERSLWWLLVQACFQQGNVERAAATAEQAVPGLPPEAAARFRGFAAHAAALLGDLHRAGEIAREGIESGDKIARAWGLQVRAALRLAESRLAEGLADSDELLGLPDDEQARSVEQIPVQYLLRGYLLCGLDRFAEASAAWETGRQLSVRAGPPFLGSYHLARAELAVAAGRWDDALAEIETALGFEDQIGTAAALRWLLVVVAVHRDDLRRAAAALVEEAGAGPSAVSHGHLYRWARALLHEAEGRPDAAFSLLYDTCTNGVGSTPAPALRWLWPDTIRLAAARDHLSAARRIGAVAAGFAALEANTTLRGTAALARGLIDRDAPVLAEAAGAFRLAGRPLFEGYAWEAVAVLRAEQGQATGARAAMERALNRYASLDATWDCARLESRCRALGVQPGARDLRPPRPEAGWHALTATEQKVAAMVAQGMSPAEVAQRMFLSRRTVQTHVSNVLAKLGLSGRMELAAEYGKQFGVPPAAREPAPG